MLSRRPSFSCSAPRFTEEDRLQERESLSDQEVLQIENDVKGHNKVHETKEQLEQGVIEMQQVLAEIEKKDSYLEALQQVPELVNVESSPYKFLRCCSHDSTKAAHRLVAYWETRKKFFGEELWLKPMTLEGAMHRDLLIVESGTLMIVRENVLNNCQDNDEDNDKDVRPILLYDRTKATPSIYTREALLRLFFYMFHVLSEIELAQFQGFIWIANKQSYTVHHFDRKTNKACWELVNSASPVKVKAYHMCWGQQRTEMVELVRNMIMPLVQKLMGKESRTHSIIHKDHVLERLAEYGIDPEYIPASLGGLVTVSYHQDWLEQRRYKEARQS